MRASSEIGDMIGKIRGDDEKDEKSLDEMLTIKDRDEIKDLVTAHPTSINASTGLGVIVNTILMLRDRHYAGDAKILEAVNKLNGTISDAGSRHFHLSFQNQKANNHLNYSVYENYVEFTDAKWYLRIYVTFPKEGQGQIHMFPLIDAETGINHSRIFWAATSNKAMCNSDFPEVQVANIFKHVASVEYYLGLAKEMLDVTAYIVRDF